MNQRIVLCLFSTTTLLCGCDQPTTMTEGEEPADTSTAVASQVRDPQAVAGLRFDGMYQTSRGSVHYLLRFYPEGNAVLINGNDTTPGQLLLRAFLKNDVISDATRGLHNVGVVRRDDSLYLVTPTRRGNIDYRGRNFGGDSIVFFKYSHINGAKGQTTYVFSPDP